jgi:hypothetical protein
MDYKTMVNKLHNNEYTNYYFKKQAKRNACVVGFRFD